MAKLKLLVVDDDQAVLAVINYCLAERYQLVLASTGDEALNVLRSEPIDFLVCDQRMPGLTGAQLCQAAAQVSPRTLQIMITAYTDFQELRAAVGSGRLIACLHKPVRDHELVDVIERACKDPVVLTPTTLSAAPPRPSARPARKRSHSDPELDLQLRNAETAAERELHDARAELQASRTALTDSVEALKASA